MGPKPNDWYLCGGREEVEAHGREDRATAHLEIGVTAPRAKEHCTSSSWRRWEGPHGTLKRRLALKRSLALKMNLALKRSLGVSSPKLTEGKEWSLQATQFVVGS